MKPESPPDPGEIASFAQFVQNLDEGGLHHDLTTEITTIVEELNDARQAGASNPKASLPIKLSVSLDGQTIDVVGDFTTKLPKVKRERSVFWTTAKNKLSRSNPTQQNLPFKQVPHDPATGEIKAV